MAISRTTAAILVLSNALVSCRTDDGGHDPCEDVGQVEMPSLSANRIADITLEEYIETDEDGNVVTYSDVQAHFNDFSELELGSTPVAALGPACVGILGIPVSEGELIPLSVNELTLSSPTVGELRLEPDESGVFAPVSLDAMFPSDGGESLTVTVTGDEGDTAFPSFEETIETPFPIEDLEVSYRGDGSLDITWTPSDATYFEATLRTDDTSGVDNRLRCYFLADDGCFTVPVEAMDWVRTGGVTDFTLLVERHVTIFSMIDDNTLTQIDATRSIRFDVDI